MATQYHLLFPFEKIPAKSNILLYGAGKTGQHYLKQLLITGYCNVIGIIDKNAQKYEDFTVPVYPLEKLPVLDYEYIVIAMSSTGYHREILSDLRDIGVPDSRIVYVGQRTEPSIVKKGAKEVEGIFARDFSLNSGERDTGKTLDEIAYDHVLRYKLASSFLQEIFSSSQSTMGIDCFCGVGYGSYLLARDLPNTHLLSIDASEEAIAFANTYYASEKIYFSCKLWPFALPENTFDFAISMESIEHVPDGEGMITAILKAIKPKGYFLFSTPNEEKYPLALNHNVFHHRHWKHDEIQHVLSGRARIIKYFGQDKFVFINGVKQGRIPQEQWSLCENYDGQTMVYICQRI